MSLLESTVLLVKLDMKESVKSAPKFQLTQPVVLVRQKNLSVTEENGSNKRKIWNRFSEAFLTHLIFSSIKLVSIFLTHRETSICIQIFICNLKEKKIYSSLIVFKSHK